VEDVALTATKADGDGVASVVGSGDADSDAVEFEEAMQPAKPKMAIPTASCHGT
jgi:hypothetical protein